MKPLFLAALHKAGLTHSQMHRLWGEKRPDYESIWNNLGSSLSLLEPQKSQKICENATGISLGRIEEKIQRDAVQIIDIFDEAYPPLLRQTPHAPYCLYVRGDVSLLSTFCFAIVGSREPFEESVVATRACVSELVNVGMTIVSGGAYGIDSLAHEATLFVGGKTIVVFGSGIDVCYPAAHKTLFEKVVTSGGALVSSFAFWTSPDRYTFPIRNEIVAGLSAGVLIAQAAPGSGTLITARLALELNRDVFVLPASFLQESARGSNELIRDGLGLCVTSISDIIDTYSSVLVDNASGEQKTLFFCPLSFDDSRHQCVYDVLEKECHVDDIVMHTGIDFLELQTILATLEIEGAIEKTALGYLRK